MVRQNPFPPHWAQIDHFGMKSHLCPFSSAWDVGSARMNRLPSWELFEEPPPFWGALSTEQRKEEKLVQAPGDAEIPWKIHFGLELAPQ